MLTLLSQYSNKNSIINRNNSFPKTGLEKLKETPKETDNGKREEEKTSPQKVWARKNELLSRAREKKSQLLLEKAGKASNVLHEKVAKETIAKTDIEHDSDASSTEIEEDTAKKPAEKKKSHLFQKKSNNKSVATEKNPRRRNKFESWGTSELVSIDKPEAITGHKQRFKVSFKYTDGDGNVKRKTVRFGKSGSEYLVDHKDQMKNKMWLAKQRGYYTPFHKNFWVNCFLCSCDNIDDAYKTCLMKLL